MTTETKSQQKDLASMDVQELRAELKALRESEAYYRSLFDNTPVSLEEADFSGVKAFLNDLRAKGVQDIRGYFEEHPEAVFDCIDTTIEDYSINQEFLSLYKAESKQDFMNRACLVPKEDTTLYNEDFYRGLTELFVALENGATRFSTVMTEVDLEGGTPFRAEVTWVIVPGYEDTWASVITCTIPFDRMRLPT